MDPRRREEIVAFIRKNTATVPWPQVQEVLLERGFTADEIAAAVDEVFPGQTGRKKSRGVWVGMAGAAIGVVIWLILAALYHGAR